MLVGGIGRGASLRATTGARWCPYFGEPLCKYVVKRLMLRRVVLPETVFLACGVGGFGYGSSIRWQVNCGFSSRRTIQEGC